MDRSQEQWLQEQSEAEVEVVEEEEESSRRLMAQVGETLAEVVVVAVEEEYRPAMKPMAEFFRKTAQSVCTLCASCDDIVCILCLAS